MPSRRDFLIGAASLAVAPLAAQTFDLAIANGRVVDPESGLDGIRHIGVTNGRIAVITPDRVTARATIDATGLVVCPGFIDLHAHQQTPETYRYQARDGVTTSFELELGTSDIDGWYAARESRSLINSRRQHRAHSACGWRSCAIRARFFPTGDARSPGGNGGRNQGHRAAHRGGPEEGRREHRRGFRLHAGGDSEKSFSRSFASRRANA